MSTEDDRLKLHRLIPDQAALVDLVRHHCDWVRDCLTDNPTDSWTPMLDVWAKEGPDDDGGRHLHALAVPFNEWQDKSNVLRQLGRGMHEKKLFPVAAVFSAEAWVTSRPADDPRPRPEPRHDPQRREAITVVGMTLGGKCLAHTVAFCTRDSGNRIVLGPFEEVATDGVRSALLEQFYGAFADAAIARFNPK